ncbi:UPF0728 protein v1g117062-like [Xenia sp. Carnegie-2017]|uniref:UPF0728 protein v1g117062-like n=1 Tax=Xenia sp. Carnegie-2017 TaxID=2897299 RepID=UPI001F03826B|nr:UPF0728 protein v1g117062-like [Xenia sp. Carnegie-2017]
MLFKMNKKHDVSVNYGPYVSFGLLSHRTSRLEGVEALLREDGHNVCFNKIPDRNLVEIVVNGEIIYTTNIQDFQFGGDGKLDPICFKVLDAVRKAF